jgi:hypothetical protein
MTGSIGAPSPFVPYLRTPMVVRRRKVMADWAASLLAGESESATLVPFMGK